MDQPNIDDLYINISKKMKADNTILPMSKQLLSLKNNPERVQLVYKNIDKYQMFPKFVEIVKSKDVSEKYRNLGNEDYKNKKNACALQKYNMAVINAPFNTQELCLAYSNRSAVNYTLRNYTDCLNDIDRAMSLKCDDKLRDKLLKRKIMCENERFISDDDNIDYQCKRQFKLSKEQNMRMPAASVSVELSYSQEMGRSVIAAQDILPGEVLALEDPYCRVVLEPFYTEYCYGCLKHSDSMIPCSDCCYVMFCGEECRMKAFKDFHKIDCKIMPMLSILKFTKIELLALRTVIQARCAYGRCEILKKVISEAESVKDPLLKGFTVDGCGKKVLDSSNYVSIHMLESNVEKRDVSDIFQKGVTASVLLHFLLNYTPFFDECGLDDSVDNKCFSADCIALYGGLLLHHCMTSPSNMHTICSLSPTHTNGYVESVRFGGGAFAFLSLLNHSCAPNVVRFNCGSSMALIALRPLKKGQQLFDNYGYHHATDDFHERQKSLKFQYKFACACEACVNKWPLYLNLSEARVTDKKSFELLSHNLLTEELVSSLTNGNRSVALNIVNQLYPYVIMLEKYAPCKDLADYQETIKQCWALFGNVAPLR